MSISNKYYFKEIKETSLIIKYLFSMHKSNRGRGGGSASRGRNSSRGGKPSGGNHERGNASANRGKSPRGPMSQGPVKKPAGVTQDFFPRSSAAAASNTKTQGFLFNQAPINKNQVKEEAKEKVAAQSQNKRSAFVARLYQDEDDDNVVSGGRRKKSVKDYENEMRVFQMDGSDIEDEGTSKKRDAKSAANEKPRKMYAREGTVAKVNRLKFTPGTLGMFAIAEIHSTYIIVNFTRNTKGFISMTDKEDVHKNFVVGQYIIAQVTTSGTSQFNEPSGLQNKKIQLSIAPELLSKSLNADNISPNMVLQGEVASKEAKGFLINFGLKDKSQGFLPFEPSTEHLLIGQYIQVVVKTVIPSSKIIKCELVTKDSNPLNNKDLTIHNIKAGFLVQSKVQRILENGIELGFLGGFSGSVFVDHLDKGEPNKYKLGDKLSARIVTVDPASQLITLSLLSHLTNFENISGHLLTQGITVGKVFENVPVYQVAFGSSYIIAVTPLVTGFLHKTHTILKEKETRKSKKQREEAGVEEAPEATFKKVELEKGQKIDKVRVKEINYFDGCPILSMREDIVGTMALNYDQITCGMYVNATIDEVNAKDHYVVLKVNDFVKGRLYIEHMADLPLKVLPPKLTQIGKEIKVRVFSIDRKTRYIEFTKKDTFFKEKTPVFQSYRDAQKGAKIVGVIVDQNEYGFIIRSFGGIKALLTFAEIKANGASQKELKAGSLVKAYVLFRKKDKGMALTLDKAKAKELRKENKSSNPANDENGEAQAQVFTKLEQYYPSEDQAREIQEKYKSLIQISQDRKNLGKVFQFRVVETQETYFICKSLDADKKSKNIIAILPKALVGKFFIHSLTIEECIFEALVLDYLPTELADLPLISAQNDLRLLKSQIPKTPEDFLSSSSFIGVISQVDRKGIMISFFDGLKKLILVKDLETVQDFLSLYKVGKVVRASKNKLDRLTLKQSVIYHSERDSEGKIYQQDREVIVQSFFQDIKFQHDYYKLQIGEKVDAFVSLAKDYGNIVSCEKYPNLTGFALSEHLVPKKTYKEGQKMSCIVLDIDFEKELLDLSERLASEKVSSTQLKVGSQYKVTIELNKDDYLLVSFKQNKQKIGVLMMQSLNNDQVPHPNAKYNMGDEIDVKVISVADNGFILTIPTTNSASLPKIKSGASSRVDVSTLQQGQLVNGVIRSLKGQCAFVQLSGIAQLVIGRLHKLESSSSAEFEGFSVGESINAKILKITKDGEKTWIELTRRKEHMSRHGNTLDDQVLKQTLQAEDLEVGKQYDAIISEVNYAFSQPIQITLSPFIKSSVSFDKIVEPEQLIKEGSSILQKFKAGAQIKVFFNADGKFSIIKKPAEKKIAKGDLVVARLVKGDNGKGITVQTSSNNFGFIEMAEITDDLVGAVIETLSQLQPLFPARVIGFDKNQKTVLSSRDSVVDPKSWEIIGPSGKSAHFQKLNETFSLNGNQRNKIFKYGADVALQEGDLCIGYITNIGKSGCFVQIGHNCTVRAGLNELSDSSNFNFSEQMPLGRIVLCRIYKVDDLQGKKRFNVTLRRSLVVYGTNVVKREELVEGNQIECTVAAMIEGKTKAIAQIKGSYLKLKVKEFKEGQVQVGDNLIVALKKVTKQKITGIFQGKAPASKQDQKEKQVEQLWTAIEEESQKDISAMKLQASKKIIDQDKLRNLNDEDEVEQQFKDLQALNEDDDMETVQNDDSDEEEMQRIIRESKNYDDEEEKGEDDEMSEGDDDEEGEDEDNDEEGEDEEDEKMQSSSEDEGNTKGKSGKQSLKSRIKEEQEIRLKEKNMRNNTDQPKTIDDYERLVVSNQDQSYVWIQYMAFMLDNLGIESARRIAERAVKSVSISNEEDKFNIWVAYMNLENNFGNKDTMQSVIKRALEVNDRQQIYIQLINMYQNSQKYQYIEDIYKQLSKKYNTSLQIWTGFIEFLFQVRSYKRDKSAPQHIVVQNLEVSEPKSVLQRALQSLPKENHVNLISKFGMLEFKYGQPENGRTMFEGIVSNFPKRMDIWSIYMDMEVKYGGKQNIQQARHLFERCLTNEFIQKKPKKMKLVFQKYMEFEMQSGNKKNIEKLRQRVEEYLEKAFTNQGAKDGSESEEDAQMN